MTRTTRENRIERSFVAHAATPQRSRSVCARGYRSDDEASKSGLGARAFAALKALGTPARAQGPVSARRRRDCPPDAIAARSAPGRPPSSVSPFAAARNCVQALGRRWRWPRRGGGALLLLFLAGLAAPQAVLAQDTVTLVSNRHYDGHHLGDSSFQMDLDVDADESGRRPNTSPRAALRFRTGPNPEGYLLDEFVIRILSANDVGSSSGAVYTDNDGRPVTQIATLSGRPREGLSVLSSASGVALSPDTWYVVRLDFNQASNVPDPAPAQVTLQYMKRGDYVAGSLPGWEISSSYRSWRARNSEWVFRGFRASFEIRGRVQGTNSAPEFGSARRTIDFRPFEGYARDVGGPVAATDADGDPLAYSLSGPDAAAFTIDRWSGQIRTRPHAVYGDDTDSAFKIRVTADDRRGGTDTAELSLRPCDPCGAAGAGIPGRPRHLFATVTAGNRIQLNWDPPAIENPDHPVTGYHVQWAWNASKTNTVSRLAVLAEDTGNTRTTYTHTVNLSDLPPDHLFGYRVRAINRSGKGLPSEFVKLTPVVDREAPRTRAARLASDGRRLEITFNEPLRNTDLPDAGQFTVFADSIEVALSPTVWEGTYGHQLRLTLARPLGSDRPIAVSYQAPGSGNAIQDLAGNRTGSFTHLAVTNDSEHTERWFQSAQVPANGQSVVLRFDRALDDSAGATPPASAFTVRVTAAAGSKSTTTTVSVGTVTVSGSTVSLSSLSRTIRANVEGEDLTRTVRVSYRDPGANALQSTDGLYVPSFEDAPVTNNSTVSASDSGVKPEPLFATTGLTGVSVDLTFDEDTNTNEIPGLIAWNITADGSDVSIGFVGSLSAGRMNFLDLNPRIRQGQTVTVSYTKPTSGNVVEDTDGNDAESFADFPVLNTSAVTGLVVHDAEGTEGTDSAITFTVTLVPATTGQVTVQYATSDGTATQPADYTSTSGTLTFAAGDTTKTVSVPIEDDGDEDSGETFTLTLSSPSGASIVDGTATGTIHNTEPGPAPRVTGVELVADDSGDGAWTSGETVEVRLTFGAAVTVADGTPTVGVTAAGEAGTLDYASGSGSATLVFSRAVTEADGSLSQVAVTANSLSLNGATIVSTSSGVAAEIGHAGTEPSAPPGDGTPPGEIGASFNDVPSEHNNEAFELEIAFTRTLAADFSYQTLAGTAASQSILSVTNASVTGARRVTPSGEERNKVWAITIEPDTGDIVIVLPASAPCGEEHAMCSVNDEPMSTPVRVTVPTTAQTQAPPPTPFKVSVDLPAEHDGTSEIKFEVEFNKEPQAGYSYTTLRNSTLKIRQGGASLTPKVKRLNAPHNDRWEVKVTPGSKENLSVSIGPFTSCTEAGAVCAAGDEVLSNAVSTTIAGPPGLAVADATAQEGPGVTVDFAVSMSRASTSSVTVDYATSDGTAQAGSDYTDTSGTLTFAAGETAKTVAVPVLDDSHDEGSETFTLTLSNASGGNAYLSDATATGTIENHDPMPKAWLTRFGRTVAGQAVDAIGGRMEGNSASHVTVAGMNLLGETTFTERDEALTLSRQLDAMDAQADNPTRSMSAQDVLRASSFSLSSGGENGSPTWTGWGRVATGGFEAEVDGTQLDGNVTSAFLGADVGAQRWLAGLAVSISEGDGDYRLLHADHDDSGSVESSLTTVYPYAKLGVNDKVDVWGLVGIGSGELTLTQNANVNRPSEAAYKTDISMRMGALGVRGEVISPDESGGLGVAVKSDAFWVSTESEAVRNTHGNLEGASGDATRLRLLVEMSRTFETGGGTLTPSAEAGLRYDGGDAETGTGIEIGGGLRYQSPRITIEGQVRTLLAHEESGYEEWGASGAIRIHPSGAGRGLSLTLAPTWGAAHSGTDALWADSQRHAFEQSTEFEAETRLETEIGYGLASPRITGVVTPYTGVSMADDGHRTWRLGTRWEVTRETVLGLEATRDEAGDGQEDTTAVLLRAAVRW